MNIQDQLKEGDKVKRLIIKIIVFVLLLCSFAFAIQNRRIFPKYKFAIKISSLPISQWSEAKADSVWPFEKESGNRIIIFQDYKINIIWERLKK